MKNTANSRYFEKLPDKFSIKHKTKETPISSFHRHQEFEILFALSDMICRIDDMQLEIPQYSLILLNPLDLHCILPKAPTACDRFVLYFSSGFIADLSTPEVNLLECFMLRADHRPNIISIPEQERTAFLSLLEQMLYYHNASKEPDSAVYGASLQARFLLGEFLLMANRLFFKESHLNATPISLGHAQLVFDITDYIRHHYREPLSAGVLANTFFISKTQLYYIFKEVSGLTVNDYLTEYRITQAKNLLINSDYSVEMISDAVGYSNLSSFSRAFKTITKLSPLQYRKRMREEA